MALQEEEQRGGTPEWIVTYGDMMSLLLTFFVLLFSMSEIKEEESQALMEALRRRFGYESSLKSMIAGPNTPMNSSLTRLKSMGRARRINTKRGGDKVQAPVGDNPRVWSIRPAEDATMGGAVRFAEGSAELGPQEIQDLRKIAEAIDGKPQKIEIRGHTTKTPLPPGSPYRSHWDLAYARCTTVMEQLTALGIDRKRFRLSVAGEYEPMHVRPDSTLQKANSRVEVLMMNELVKDLEGTPQKDQGDRDKRS